MNGLFSNIKTTFNEYRIKSENESLLILESFLPWHKTIAMILVLIFLFPLEGSYIFRKGFNGIPLILYIVYIFPYLIVIYALARKKIITFDSELKRITEKTTPFGSSGNIDFSDIAEVRVEQDKKLDDAPGAERVQYVRCYKVYLELTGKEKKYYIDTFENRDNAYDLANKIALLTKRSVVEKNDVLEPKVINTKKILVYAICIISFLAIAKYSLDNAHLEGLVVLIVLIMLFFIIKYYINSNKK